MQYLLFKGYTTYFFYKLCIQFSTLIQIGYKNNGMENNCILIKAILTTGLEDLQIEQKLEANLFNQCKLVNYKYSMVYLIPPYIGR